MGAFPRRLLACALSAALSVGAPLRALAADPPRGPAPAVAAATRGDAELVDVPPAEALARMRALGLFTDDNDPRKSFLADGSGRLTELGATWYNHFIRQRYRTPTEELNLREAAQQFGQQLTRLSENGPYGPKQAEKAQRLIADMTARVGNAAQPQPGSYQATYRSGVLVEAAMTGAQVADPPRREELIHHKTKDGNVFTDERGVVFRTNDGEATVYNRQLHKLQVQMNQSLPPQLTHVPTNGVYNEQMLDYQYWKPKNQLDALREMYRRQRGQMLAELLGVAGAIKEDMWQNERLIKDLEAQAALKMYTDRGRAFSVLELVNSRFAERERLLRDSVRVMAEFEADLKKIKEQLKGNPLVSDAQARQIVALEQRALKPIHLALIDTQLAELKGQLDKIDPSSAESQGLSAGVDYMKLSPEQKALYKQRMREQADRMKEQRNALERARRELLRTDPQASMDRPNILLQAAQKELQHVSADFQLVAEVPMLSYQARFQTEVGPLNFGTRAARNVYEAFAGKDSDYARGMRALEKNTAELERVAALIADGKMADARRLAAELGGDGMARALQGQVIGDGPRTSELMRMQAALKAARDRVTAVHDTNRTLDSIGGFVTWSVAIAAGAPAARFALHGVGSSRTLAAMAQANVPVLSRSAIVLSEISLHTAARLQTLGPGAGTMGAVRNSRLWWTAPAVPFAVRTLNVAARQAAFTGMAGGISGAFTMVTHYWDKASLWLTNPGDVAAIPLPWLRTGIMKPGHSMFSSGWEAFAFGAKQGMWWANTPMQNSMSPLHNYWWMHPALLSYVGLPSTVFRGSRAARFMDVLSARGVVGTAGTEIKHSWSQFRPVGLAVEENVGGGFLQNLSRKGVLGFIPSFTLSMADNVAKFALFSEAAGWVGRQWAYHHSYRDERDLERRIKGANIVGEELLMSPAWMLLPTFAAHQARDAAAYIRSTEGLRQYEETKQIYRIANAKEGDSLRFVRTPKTPISQRIFEASYFSDQAGDFFTVTKEIKREAIQKEMVLGLGGPGARAKDINPLRFYEITKLKDGQDFITQRDASGSHGLRVNDEVRLVAHRNFVESLVENVDLSARILNAKLGTEVKGFGFVQLEVQKDVAVALYTAGMQIGKPTPGSLAKRVGEILKPYLDANQSVMPAANKFVDAVKNLGKVDGAPFEKILDSYYEKAKSWKENDANKKEYTQLVREWRDELKSAKLSSGERLALDSMFDYIEAIYNRFNYFNKAELVAASGQRNLDGLRGELAADAQAVKQIELIKAKLKSWAEDQARINAELKAKGEAPRLADGKGISDGSFKDMWKRMLADIEGNKALSEFSRAKLTETVKEIASSPWVLHDSKNAALPNWRPEQFEALMATLTAWANMGRGDNAVRIFQMLKTGGGKTMVGYEGLLPLIEADAAKRGMKVVFLTVQSNLEAQARVEFIAYKKIGSTLTFDTYEGFKGKIAEGKTKGANVLDQYWILGDEMDGAALQPALTIGQVTGYITRMNSVMSRLNEENTGLVNRLGRSQSMQGREALNEARRIQGEAYKLQGPDAPGVQRQADRVEYWAGRYLESNGQPMLKAAAEVELRQNMAGLQRLLDKVPSSQSARVDAARSSLTRLQSALEAPPPAQPGGFKGLMRALIVEDGGLATVWQAAKRVRSAGDAPEIAFQKEMVKELSDSFTRQKNLMTRSGDAAGLKSLASAAELMNQQLGARLSRLEGERAAAPAQRAAALEQEIGLVKQELQLVQRFRGPDATRRLAGVQDEIAAARNRLQDRPAAPARGPDAALLREYELGRAAARADDRAPPGPNELRRAASAQERAADQRRLTQLDSWIRESENLPRWRQDVDGLKQKLTGVKPGEPGERALRERLAKRETQIRRAERLGAWQREAKELREKYPEPAAKGSPAGIGPRRAERLARYGEQLRDGDAPRELQGRRRKDAERERQEKARLAKLDAASPEAAEIRRRQDARELGRWEQGAELRVAEGERRVAMLERDLEAARRGGALRDVQAQASEAAAAREALQKRRVELYRELAQAKGDQVKSESLKAELKSVNDKLGSGFKEHAAREKAAELRPQVEADGPARAPPAEIEAALGKARLQLEADRAELAAGPKDPAQAALRRELSAPRLSRGEARLGELEAMARAMEDRLPPEGQAIARARAEALERLYKLGRESRELDEALIAARRDGKPQAELDALAAKREALQRDFAAAQTEIGRLKDQLAGAGAGADLSWRVRRIEHLELVEARLAGELAAAEGPGGDRSKLKALESELAAVRREGRRLVKDTLEHARRLFETAADHDVLAVVKAGAKDWEDAAIRLINLRRELLESFAGAENPFYTAFRDMKETARGMAFSQRVLNPDPKVHEPAKDAWLRRVEGKSLLLAAPEILKLGKQVWRGEPVNVNVDTVGYTRVHAAKMLKSLYQDPLMPLHQKDAMFWNLFPSLLWPNGMTPKFMQSSMNWMLKKLGKAPPPPRSSWVRTELLRMVQGFHENPEFIRIDHLSGRINVVHNGQWFESMDNEGRRFWELEYGADLTLPYTHQSISTIKDITTFKGSRFVSFSGTAGKEFKDHLEKHGVKIVGTGSSPPKEGMHLKVVSGGGSLYDEVGRALTSMASRRGEVVVELKDAPIEVKTAWFESAGGKLERPVTLAAGELKDPQAQAWLRANGEPLGGERYALRRLDGAPDPVRQAALHELNGPVVMRLRDHKGPVLDKLQELRALQGDADAVVLRASDLKGASAETQALLRSALIKKGLLNDTVSVAELPKKFEVGVLTISEVKGPDAAASKAAQDWLRQLRAQAENKDSGLVVITVPGTRALKVMREYLLRSGLSPDEISMVFADSEFLRGNVPSAQVAKQMNLDSLTKGRTRVLILDTRVGGRGLDLNYKGDRDNPSPGAFRGYTDFHFLSTGPADESVVHGLQAVGRIDAGRVLAGARRTFNLVLDLKGVGKDRVFREMIAGDPFFDQIRSSPEFQDFARRAGAGSKPDWELIHRYLEAKSASGAHELYAKYVEVVTDALKRQQGGVEIEQLQSSSVDTSARQTRGRFPGLEGMR